MFVARIASRRPYLAGGWFWYVGTLLPVSGLVQVGSHAMADRYTYLPLVGLFIMVAWGVPEILGAGRIKRVLLPTVAASVVLACAVATRAQVMTWQNTVVLWQHTLRVMPDTRSSLASGRRTPGSHPCGPRPVSYTHLTLPTIYSV